MILLDELSHEPLYEQIVVYIKKQIKDGVLKPGDRLLSVREMATTLNINPNTVNRAYKTLEKEELIVVLIGKGTFVKNRTGIAPSKSTKSELKLKLDLILLDIYYQNISQEEATNWVNLFYDKVGDN
ncbi:MAG: GntR family transcriptional regulator [Vagococcus sp.]|uniref:GntR family transcriptional regulator n=1 Tax=Vagococcus sp. TaxID=1933889 RepID=UPI002FC84142